MEEGIEEINGYGKNQIAQQTTTQHLLKKKILVFMSLDLPIISLAIVDLISALSYLGHYHNKPF